MQIVAAAWLKWDWRDTASCLEEVKKTSGSHFSRVPPFALWEGKTNYTHTPTHFPLDQSHLQSLTDQYALSSPSADVGVSCMRLWRFSQEGSRNPSQTLFPIAKEP